MSQKPAKRHVIAEIRIKAELTQAELAKILGVAAVSIQRIEQGRLGLSKELAEKAEKELGISADWLLANDPTKPAVTPHDVLWTKDFYEFTQGSVPVVLVKDLRGQETIRVKLNAAVRSEGTIRFGGAEDAAEAFIALTIAETVAVIHAMLEGTKRLPKQGILIHRLRKSLAALQEDFKPDEATLKEHQPKIQKADRAYKKILTAISETASERLWSNLPE
jgi:transcriptional regulator with XRE-family HTH domain